MKACSCLFASTRKIVIPENKDAKFLFIADQPWLIDRVLKKPFVSNEGALIKQMALSIGIELKECVFTYTVLCRSVNESIEPAHIFACTVNIPDNAFKGVILLGGIAEKYYKNRFPGVPKLTMTNPEVIVKKGGKVSSLYIDNLNKLERFYADIKP